MVAADPPGRDPKGHGAGADGGEPAPLLILPEEAAAELGVSRLELRRMRADGTGPTYVTIAGTVRYVRDEVLAWREAHEPR